MKLWDKGYKINKNIEEFTVQDDYILDMYFIKYDIEATKAHALMLKEINILSDSELQTLLKGLDEINDLIDNNQFAVKPEQEDCHTAIEEFLTSRYGDVGKKIHTGRSRNDQILTAIRLYEKKEIITIKHLIFDFIKSVENQINLNTDIILPGFTHTRKAMPMPLPVWLGAFINSMYDNLVLLESVNTIIDNNPLGSAAGFGVPLIKINKELTTKILGFERYYDTDIYYQNTRGKNEAIIISLLTSIMFDLNKLASDIIFYTIDNYNFINLPKEFCTGSSIMPHKKNPDALEIVRANYHLVLSEEMKVKSLISNLISGYHRDFQLTKSALINSIEITKSSLEIMTLILNNLLFNKEEIEKEMSEELFAVEKVNQLLLNGVSFRDAYRKISDVYNAKEQNLNNK